MKYLGEMVGGVAAGPLELGAAGGAVGDEGSVGREGSDLGEEVALTYG